jgi:hypothetical protein
MNTYALANARDCYPPLSSLLTCRLPASKLVVFQDLACEADAGYVVSGPLYFLLKRVLLLAHGHSRGVCSLVRREYFSTWWFIEQKAQNAPLQFLQVRHRGYDGTTVPRTVGVRMCPILAQLYPYGRRGRRR